MRLLGIVTKETTVSGVNAGLDTIGLFFGGMVVARALVPTGIFDYLGARVLRLIRGDGRLLLLSIIVMRKVCKISGAAARPVATDAPHVAPFGKIRVGVRS